jgi:hypothetical protein
MGTERFGAFLARGQLSTNFIHSEECSDFEIPIAALKLFLWSKEEEEVVVVVDVAPDRKDVLHLDDSGPRLPAEARPDGAEGILATSLSPRLEGGRNV